MVSTVSYKIVFPTFLLVSVLVATWAKMSFIASEVSGSFFPKILSKRRILTLNKFSMIKLNYNVCKILNTHLQERIANPTYVMFRRISSQY